MKKIKIVKSCAFIIITISLLIGYLFMIELLNNASRSVVIENQEVKYIIIGLFVVLWIIITYALITNAIQKYIIQHKINKSKFKDILIKSFRYSKNNNSILLNFKSLGFPLSEWEKQKLVIESVINYKIVYISQGKRMDRVNLIVIKANQKRNKEILYDE